MNLLWVHGFLDINPMFCRESSSMGQRTVDNMWFSRCSSRPKQAQLLMMLVVKNYDFCSADQLLVPTMPSWDLTSHHPGGSRLPQSCQATRVTLARC